MSQIKHHRQILCYDPVLGHKYVPNINARLIYGNDGYFIKTDNEGFRNESEFGKEKNKIKIIALGDSYTAGDGVSNKLRFTDLIADTLDCEIHNLAVSGFGVDQQLLAYEKYGIEKKHDAILFCPLIHDLTRNLMSARIGIDRISGDDVLIPKPFYKIENGRLILQNVPVPRDRKPFNKKNEHYKKKNNILYNILKKITPTFVKNSTFSLRIQLKRLYKYTINFIKYKILPEKIHTEDGIVRLKNLNNPDSNEWMHMKMLIKELLDVAGDKKIFIVPLPYNENIVYKLKPHYTNIFKGFESDPRVRVIDLYPELIKNNKRNNGIYLPICGHFNSRGHRVVANEILQALTNEFDIRKRDQLKSKNILKESVYILGISCFYHDSAAAIIKDGEIIAAVQEERFSRVKYDSCFPRMAINYCLEKAGINANDLNGVCYYDKESWTIERVIHNAILLGERGNVYWEMASNSLYKKLKLSQTIRNTINYIGEIFKTEHHISHAASAFYPSPFKESAILIVDAVGEWACTTIARADSNGIKILRQQNYPHSLGLLYSAFTYFCGFKVNSGEYKLMGLAPYGKPKYYDLIKKRLVDIKNDGSINLNLDYFSFIEGRRMTNEKFNKSFDGPPREPETEITQREADIAASIQKVTEEIVLKMALYAYELTNSDYLVLGGGVALNCVANGKLISSTPFKDIWIQPAAGDAGGAVGAAFDLYYSKFYNKGKKDISIQSHTYFGPKYSDEEIYHYIDTKGLPFHKFDDKGREKIIAKLLNEKKVIGYFDGHLEFGPRALGARSIIADPTDITMQSKLNLKIKFRESFRPFAPIVLEEKLSKYFMLDRPSPYMLLVASVSENIKYKVIDNEKEPVLFERLKTQRSKLPAITHIDFSARIQSLKEKNNPSLYKLIHEFGKLSGFTVLVNTSFNLRGEPIVCTPDDAYKCFMRSEMDVLVFGKYYLLKEEQPVWEEKEKWERLFTLD